MYTQGNVGYIHIILCEGSLDWQFYTYIHVQMFNHVVDEEILLHAMTRPPRWHWTYNVFNNNIYRTCIDQLQKDGALGLRVCMTVPGPWHADSWGTLPHRNKSSSACLQIKGQSRNPGSYGALRVKLCADAVRNLLLTWDHSETTYMQTRNVTIWLRSGPHVCKLCCMTGLASAKACASKAVPCARGCVLLRVYIPCTRPP